MGKMNLMQAAPVSVERGGGTGPLHRPDSKHTFFFLRHDQHEHHFEAVKGSLLG